MKKQLERLKVKTQKWKKDYKHEIKLVRANLLMLAPGFLITVLGLVLIATTSLIGLLAGTIVMALGMVTLELTWRFLKFKNKVENFIKEVEGRVIIGGLGGLSNNQAANLEEFIPQKKILYH